eukprot:199423_1
MKSTNKQKRKKTDVKQRSLMKTVKNSIRHIRANKTQGKRTAYKRSVTPTAISNASYAYNSRPTDGARTPSFVTSKRKEADVPSFPGTQPHHNTISNKPAAATTKSKSKKKAKPKPKPTSPAKTLLPINVPSLYINKGPNAQQQMNFNHLLYNPRSIALNKAIIAISIDIEAVYNEEYDNNYNRKVLGPIQAVQFPITIDCHCDEHEAQTQPKPIPKWQQGRHQKSASISGSPLVDTTADAPTRSRGGTTVRHHTPSQSSPRLDLSINFSKRRQDHYDKTASKVQQKKKIKLKFEDQYDKSNQITPDELEILARKLVREMEEEEEEEQRHLLHNTAKKKADAVSFGLQFVNSMKQVTSTLTALMQHFRDGLNDLLRVCEQFMELIVDPLPRAVYNDYADVIGQYGVLLQRMSQMSDGFDTSSQKLKDSIPVIRSVLSSDISHRIAQYDSYINDMKMADSDLKSLEIHCDRGLRRLFREIPKPQHLMKDCPGLPRKKSLKQHKNIRIFGRHYVSSNSDDYICRSVPSKVRDGIIGDYIHYVTLMDTMNWNTKKCYNEILPKINIEFEENQRELTQHIEHALRNLRDNLPNSHVAHAHTARARMKPLAPAKPYSLHRNELMASPMHTYDVIAKINEYVIEVSEQKTYDEFEMVKLQKKNFKQQKIQENGKFSLKNYRTHFDSANFINEEVIESFFNNHYYHLGDIMFEIPELYEAFENHLRMKLSEENLLFLRTVDDIYFNVRNQTFNHSTATQQTRDIYKQFISENSKNQINLPGNVRKRINNDLKKIHKIKDPLSIFDKAYDGISSLIHKEALPNFYKSQHFKKWYEKERQQNEKLWKKERKMMKK